MEQMLETVLEYLFTGIGTILGALIAYLAVIARQLIVEKIGEAQFNRLFDLVLAVVRAVEQEGKVFGWDGDEKLEQALIHIYRLRDTLNIKATDAQIRLMVEAAVQAISIPKLEVYDTGEA